MPLDLVGPLKYLKASLQMISIPHFSGQDTQESRPFSNKSLSYPKMSFSASRTLNVPVFLRLLGLKQLPEVISATLSSTKWTLKSGNGGWDGSFFFLSSFIPKSKEQKWTFSCQPKPFYSRPQTWPCFCTLQAHPHTSPCSTLSAHAETTYKKTLPMTNDVIRCHYAGKG